MSVDENMAQTNGLHLVSACACQTWQMLDLSLYFRLTFIFLLFGMSLDTNSVRTCVSLSSKYISNGRNYYNFNNKTKQNDTAVSMVSTKMYVRAIHSWIIISIISLDLSNRSHSTRSTITTIVCRERKKEANETNNNL